MMKTAIVFEEICQLQERLQSKLNTTEVPKESFGYLAGYILLTPQQNSPLQVPYLLWPWQTSPLSQHGNVLKHFEIIFTFVIRCAVFLA